jgi:hypothetical protein
VGERRLRIDHFVVRMRGVAEPQARELAAGLGEAVLRRLMESSAIGSGLPGVQHIERIDAGSVALASRDRLATHLAKSVMAHLPPAKGDR